MSDFYELLAKHNKRVRQAEIRNERIVAGKCAKCSEPRGEDGTKTMCRPCAKAWNEYRRVYRRRTQLNGKCRECRRSRGEDGTATLCRACADRTNAFKEKYRKRRRKVRQ